MNNDVWLEANDRYLAASLHWLRLRLEKLTQPNGCGGAQISPRESGVEPGLQSSFTGSQGTQIPTLSERPPMPVDEKLTSAASEREALAAGDPPPALILLAQRLGLSNFERDTLFLCVGMELDPDLGTACAKAQHNPGRTYATFGLALSLFDDPAWEALSPHRPLRYSQLIEINQPGATPLTASPLRADERISNYVKGLNVLDDRVTTFFQPVPQDLPLSASQERTAEGLFRQLSGVATEGVVPVIQLIGNDAGSKLAVAAKICSALNRQLYQTAIEALPTSTSELQSLARLWQRESLLLPVALYAERTYTEVEPGSKGHENMRTEQFLSKDIGLAFIGVRDAPIRVKVPTLFAEIHKPTATEQARAWRPSSGSPESIENGSTAAAQLAGQFDLNLQEIREIVETVAEDSDRSHSTEFWDRCRNLTRPQLDALAQRLEPKSTWDDLVLPEEPLNLLRQITSQVRQRHKVYEEWGFAERMNRGFGISALFFGETGTGKTMAAEVIANDLRLDLYRIDLSAIVSKYIGETEKNLRRLFESAERGGVILFFDEADALFGKRSEVKDSHDRYANIEVNYLLQRMEVFNGLAILATNMKSALDAAFMRRLRFVVNFHFPGVAERKSIWEKALPNATPKEALDLDRLARLNLSGGHIHNIALNAAFLAAHSGSAVTMPAVLKATRTELRKLEKAFNEAELKC
jgi:hypothetical protein